MTGSTGPALIAPLAVEFKCFRSLAASGIAVLQSGQGAVNAAHAARTAIDAGARALISVGVAGALSGAMRAGDFIVPSVVVDEQTGESFDCAAGWVQGLHNQAAALGTTHDGALLGVSEVLVTPQQKQQAFSKYAAVAADMESVAVARVAHAAGAQFAVLRAVSDEAADELPSDVGQWIDAHGNTRVMPVVRAVLSPWKWGKLMRTGRCFGAAKKSLCAISRRLAEADAHWMPSY